MASTPGPKFGSRATSQSAQAADRLASRRNALIWASERSSASATGTSTSPMRWAAFSRRCPSTTVPSDFATMGMRKPNSLIAAHICTTTASFLRGFRA